MATAGSCNASVHWVIMSEREHLELMARYNESMNLKLYDAAARLRYDTLAADTGAFFGSLLGTMNHLVAGDTIWLKRFSTHPARFLALEAFNDIVAPTTVDAIYSEDLSVLATRRRWLDAVILAMVGELCDADLNHVLHYASTKGVPSQKRFSSLLFHFFNHQTHHRGQASTQLSQAGVDIGVTDLLVLIPNEGI